MLKVSSIHKTFNPGRVDEKIALTGMDIAVQKGEFGVIIGSNGAGKSTLLNAIAGSFFVDSGSIVLGGEDLTHQPPHLRAKRVARVFQDAMKGTAMGMTVAENMLLAERRGHPVRLVQGITSKRLAAYKERISVLGLGLENRMTAKVDLLSGGQRQALSLIMAVGGQPDLLLLDEHTAALDPKTAELVMNATVKAIDAFKLTALMVTHNMQHAIDYGNKVLMLNAGKLLLEIGAEEKAKLQVPDLVQKFSVKSDQMLLGARK